MKQAQALNGIVIGGAVSLLATQPVWAATTQVTGVQLNPTGSELKLILETKAGDTRPQIFTVHHGNELVTDILNTQLSLSKGDSFRQEHPMPGVTALVVSQLDANRVRVTVSGTKSAPTGQILQSNPEGITLGISTAQNNQAAVSNTVSPLSKAPASPETPTLQSPSTPTLPAKTPKSPQTVAQIPTTQPVQSTPTPTAPTSSTIPIFQTQPSTMPAAQTQNLPSTVTQTPTPQPIQPAQTPSGPTVVPPAPVTPPNPDVLVPNPKITIDGVPASATGAAQPVAPAPPFLPRAIAPPVGDIAISNINASANSIDLGTDVRVPRLVLREASVREVLSLLAREAGLNVAFTDGGGGAAGAPPGGAGGGQQTISLDLENEAVQDVFNYVLQISGLQANRVGRTILVGSRLPDAARNIVARTLRLNQVTAVDGANFLVAQGAERQQITRQTTLTVVGEGAAAQRIENTTTTVQKIAPQVEQAQAQGGAVAATGPLTLRGLLVTPDDRLNQLTLVGEPRQVEIATALLNQLDLRRRQVAVNVKVIDVNLTGTDAFNSSFSFGIGNAFFVNDNGAASFNYGGTRPPTSLEVQSSLASPTVIGNPYSSGTPFIDLNRSINIPNGAFDANGRLVNATAYQPIGPFGPNGSPFSPGITNVTIGTPTTVTGIGANRTVTPGTPGTISYSLPTLFQFPKKLLTALQAQITSGNAKILTDPTLVVQEGQTATVNLTQEVVGNIRSETQSTTNQTTRTVTAEIREAGLILEINVRKIDDNGFVNLTVNPRVTSIGSTQNLSIDQDTNQIALLNVRQLNSGEIRLRDAQTLILSGIIQDQDRTTVSKVPILGDIPLLGALFRSTSRTNQRQEVIVLLTPQIINDSEGSSFGYNYTPGRDARQILQRQGLPPQGNK